MPARSHPRWIVVTLATALVLPGAGASSAESRSSNPGGIFELNRALAYAALPQERCGSGPLPALTGCLNPDDVAPHQPSDAASQPAGDVDDPWYTDPGFTLEPTATIQTPGWYAALTPRSDDTFVRVHGYGDVAAVDAEGYDIWSRPSMTFLEDWGIVSNNVPFVLLGASPLDPFLLVSERPYAVGDLTDDGVEDVAVAHLAGSHQGVNTGFIATSSFVTVLDGRNGSTLWSREYPGYVTQLVVTEGILVIGNEAGSPKPNGLGEEGSTTSLYGVSFSGSPSGAIDLWSVSTGRQWARWLAAEPAGPGRVAVSWTDKPLGQVGIAGRVLLVDAATGAVPWTRQTNGYPRTLRFDASRDQVVVHEEMDPEREGPVLEGRYDYAISGMRASDGSVAAGVSREDAVLLSLRVADVAGSTESEWVAGDASTTVGPPFFNERLLCGRILAHDPASGEDVWSTESCSHDLSTGVAPADDAFTTPLDLPYGLMVTDGPDGPLVVATSISNTDGSVELEALSGANGEGVWRRTGSEAFALYMAPLPVGGQPSVLVATSTLSLRAYDLRSGARLLDAPLLYDIQAAEVADVNLDGAPDVLVGTRSRGVFALDGTSLADVPRVLWRTPVGGSVHQLAVADLDGDGADEVVAAASSSIRVLRLADGSERLRIEPSEGFVWTFTLGDLAGDARPEIVVPTTTLGAYRGTDGSLLWEHLPQGDAPVTVTFSTAAVADRKAVAQYLIRPPGQTSLAPRHHQAVVAIDGPTGAVAWSHLRPCEPCVVRLWRSVVADRGLGGGTGWGVAVAYQVDLAQPRVDVHDLDTGEVLWHGRTTRVSSEEHNQIHQGLLVDGGDVLGFNWSGVVRFAADGVTQMPLGGTLGGGFARLGQGDVAFIRTYDVSGGTVVAYPRESISGPVTNKSRLPHTSWSGLNVGDMVARDLDADGADELIAYPYDWSATIEVGHIEGIQYLFAGPTRARGLVVLDVKED